MKKYCLDTNCFIEAWNKYYSPQFCSSYWDVLGELADKDIIFITEKVKEEIEKKDDKLSEWLKTHKAIVKKITNEVQVGLKEVFLSNPDHQRLVDNTRNRSQADPWVIAHAMAENAVVVTKEARVDTTSSDKIKIPNVCENLKIEWIDDFQLIKEIDIHFECRIKAT